MVQNFTAIAAGRGRTVHLLQWDLVRGAFDGASAATGYPEIDGVTHPVIRKAVGLWAREAVARWDREHRSTEHLLVCEAPLIGNRMTELVRTRDDATEPLLCAPHSTFYIPAPSDSVRAVIENLRARDTGRPRHVYERANAAPAVVTHLWQEIHHLATHYGLTSHGPDGHTYRQDRYIAVYERVLAHRHTTVLPINDILPVTGSAYDVHPATRQLRPRPDDVERALARAANMPADALRRETERWYEDNGGTG
ncbi:hypothetical protein DVK44_16535 [Streptomyces paludis]|uniref:Uncharacterized protein n=2 Tax=Streptomyces paludis TaxID=2282738 RepID=A0A345HQQ9_9ACTN|nr:hypothetical protein DVK44_16535 [Streptomyces paludis]